MASIGLDGTLKLSFPLVEIDGEHIGLRCVLEHRIELDAWGHAHSRWRFTGLESSLVPEGRDNLCWKPAGAGAVRFERAKIAPFPRITSSSPWLIRESGADAYEISSSDSCTWSYAQGLLVSASHPAVGEFRFETQGGRIRRVLLPDGADPAQVLLQVDYNPVMQVTRLVTGSTILHTFEWDQLGHLVAWRRADGSEVGFKYRDSLLVEMREPGKPAANFQWQANPDADRGDSRWPAPVHLAADQANDYSIDLAAAGIVIEVRCRATGKSTTTILNPLRQRVEQRASADTLVVTLHKGATAPGAIERVEDGRGVTLEDYRYNARAQLTGATRLGETEQSFDYDDAGQLKAVHKIDRTQ